MIGRALKQFRRNGQTIYISQNDVSPIGGELNKVVEESDVEDLLSEREELALGKEGISISGLEVDSSPYSGIVYQNTITKITGEHKPRVLYKLSTNEIIDILDDKIKQFFTSVGLIELDKDVLNSFRNDRYIYYLTKDGVVSSKPFYDHRKGNDQLLYLRWTATMEDGKTKRQEAYIDFKTLRQVKPHVSDVFRSASVYNSGTDQEVDIENILFPEDINSKHIMIPNLGGEFIRNYLRFEFDANAKYLTECGFSMVRSLVNKETKSSAELALLETFLTEPLLKDKTQYALENSDLDQFKPLIEEFSKEANEYANIIDEDEYFEQLRSSLGDMKWEILDINHIKSLGIITVVTYGDYRALCWEYDFNRKYRT